MPLFAACRACVGRDCPTDSIVGWLAGSLARWLMAIPDVGDDCYGDLTNLGEADGGACWRGRANPEHRVLPGARTSRRTSRRGIGPRVAHFLEDQALRPRMGGVPLGFAGSSVVRH